MPDADSYSRLTIRVLLEPPDQYKNMNQEQDFALPLGAELQDYPDGGLKALGAVVSLNKVRYASASTQNDKLVLDRQPRHQKNLAALLVPVMLHNDPATIVLSGVTAAGEEAWRLRIPYDIRALRLPIGEVASTWAVMKAAASAADPDQLVCKLKMPQIAAERVRMEDAHAPVTVQLPEFDGVKLILTLQRAVNAETNEPLTFFVDRWWSLTRIAMVAPAARFGL
jgi:hypothetical protein